MKAILEFDLPEELRDYEDAIHGWKWRSTVVTVDNWLRTEIKFKDRSELQDIRDKLREIVDYCGLRLDE